MTENFHDAPRHGLRFSFLVMAGLIATLCIPNAAQAKLYKWVDENGNVTYSQQKPPNGKAQALDLKGYESADPEAGQKIEAAQEESQEQDKDREFAASEAAANKDRQERMKKNCEISRQNLRVLKNSRRIRDTNAAGEVYYLEPEAVQRKIDEAEQQVKDFC